VVACRDSGSVQQGKFRRRQKAARLMGSVVKDTKNEIPKSSRKNIFIFWVQKFKAGLFEKNMTARVAIQKS